MTKLMNILMLSCKKATELIDKKYVMNLSVKEKVMLGMHTSMCKACSTYEKQSKILENLLHKHIQIKLDVEVPIIKNDKLKEQIISKL